MTDHIFGFKTRVNVGDETVTKTYIGIDKEQQDRISKLYYLLSEQGLGPEIHSIEQVEPRPGRPGLMVVEMEKVKPIEELIDSGLDVETIRRKGDEAIARLHELGYGHGDLHVGNMGYRGPEDNPEIVLFDIDFVYEIAGDIQPWLAQWMKDGFSFQGTVQEFAEYDYENWHEGLDDLTGEPEIIQDTEEDEWAADD